MVHLIDPQEKASAFVFDICGVVINVVLDDLIDIDELLERYRYYLTARVGDWKIAVHLSAGSPHEGAERRAIAHTEWVTRFAIDGFDGQIDFRRRVASVRVPNIGAAVSGLERVAAYICMQTLPRQYQSMLIHGAGVEIEGNGYIFFGASGRGKSTIASLAKAVGHVLADELVVVDMVETTPLLRSTPFWGTGTSSRDVVSSGRRAVPLMAMYELNHADSHACQRLKPADAVRALLMTEKVATERVSSANYWLAMAGRITAKIPIYRLELYPSQSIWSYLDLVAKGGN